MNAEASNRVVGLLERVADSLEGLAVSLERLAGSLEAITEHTRNGEAQT